LAGAVLPGAGEAAVDEDAGEATGAVGSECEQAAMMKAAISGTAVKTKRMVGQILCLQANATNPYPSPG
jgi:hypothetical protein